MFEFRLPDSSWTVCKETVLSCKCNIDNLSCWNRLKDANDFHKVLYMFLRWRRSLFCRFTRCNASTGTSSNTVNWFHGTVYKPVVKNNLTWFVDYGGGMNSIRVYKNNGTGQMAILYFQKPGSVRRKQKWYCMIHLLYLIT